MVCESPVMRASFCFIERALLETDEFRRREENFSSRVRLLIPLAAFLRDEPGEVLIRAGDPARRSKSASSKTSPSTSAASCARPTAKSRSSCERQSRRGLQPRAAGRAKAAGRRPERGSVLAFGAHHPAASRRSPARGCKPRLLWSRRDGTCIAANSRSTLAG